MIYFYYYIVAFAVYSYISSSIDCTKFTRPHVVVIINRAITRCILNFYMQSTAPTSPTGISYTVSDHILI